MKARPGIMLYYDMIPVLGMLSDTEKGALFQAIMEYGYYGERKPLPDKLELLWPLVQHRLDVDQERYDAAVIKRKYAAYVRWEKQNLREPLSYVQWTESRGYEKYDEQILNALA